MVNIGMTGHRLPPGMTWKTPSSQRYKFWEALYDYLFTFFSTKYKEKHGDDKEWHVWNGGAQGFDQCILRVFLDMQPFLANEGIKLRTHLCLPWPGYWNTKWPSVVQGTTKALWERCNEWHYAFEKGHTNYGAGLNERNKIIVNALRTDDLLISFWNRMRTGGTHNCLQYAWQQRGRTDLYGEDRMFHMINIKTDPHGPTFGLVKNS